MNNQGYYDTPYAWEAPASFEVTEETEFDFFATPVGGDSGDDYYPPAPANQPFNPPALGLSAFYSNAWKSMKEILLQQTPSIPIPPSYTYEGPIGGGGALGLFAPAPGSQKYREFVVRQEEKEHYNPEKTGIAPLPNNAKSAAIETAKQTQGPGLWERFTGAVIEGYNAEPEDENTFMNSITGLAGNIVKPSNYAILAVGGVVVLLVLLIK